jgi:hypothetical protein
MNTQAVTTKDSFPVNIQAQIAFGQKALKELRLLVRNRPNPVIINGKRYLEFCDWQILGAFFGISPYVVETKEITQPRQLESVPGWTALDVIGFKARAEARQDGKIVSAADAECMFDEKNWKGKPRFQVLSMAETRACAKVLRQCLQWVVKLPDEKGKPTDQEFAEEAAEEAEQLPLKS